ncbi:MAG: hypothetical protein GPJ54_11070 [Candidatus Heimdallarchaeota archaeon]|nr:hypothetical protein [Candidatus Heimdallarchaeota archaeon]
MENTQLINLLRSQFGEYLRDEKYKSAFEEALEVFATSPMNTKSSTDNFYLFLHSLLIHVFGKIKRLEDEMKE